jgi:hypothetical protein
MVFLLNHHFPIVFFSMVYPAQGRHIFHRVLSEDMLNRVPWDLVYQEWWGEYPPQVRDADGVLLARVDQSS